MSTIKIIRLDLWGQDVSDQELSVAVGETVQWQLHLRDQIQHDLPLDLTGCAVTMSLVRLDAGVPIEPPVIPRQGDIQIPSTLGIAFVPWASGDTVPSGKPLASGFYGIDVFTQDGSGNRLQSMAFGVIRLTHSATLPSTVVTPLPAQSPFQEGQPGIIFVIPRTIAQPADGRDFLVHMNTAPNAAYAVLPVPVSDEYTGISIPDGGGDRTQSQFRVKTAGTLPDGAVVEFFVFRTGLLS